MGEKTVPELSFSYGIFAVRSFRVYLLNNLFGVLNKISATPSTYQWKVNFICNLKVCMLPVIQTSHVKVC